MVAAAVAAGVAVAATVASTAMSATQGGPNMPTLGGATGPESQGRRAQFNALDAANQYTDRAAWEQNLVTPSLYEQAGFTPTYDTKTMADASTARGQADAAQNAFDTAQQKLVSITGANRKSLLKYARQAVAAKGLTGRAKRQALRSTKKGLKQTANQARLTKQGAKANAAQAAATAQDLESRAGRITGLTDNGGPGSADDKAINALLSSRALNDLKTGRSVDPTMSAELQRQEGSIRASLAREFGPDYENTTAGRAQLAAFNQSKTESLYNASQREIGSYEGMSLSNRKDLNAVAAGRMSLATTPGNVTESSAANFGDLSARFQNFNEMMQQDRLAQFNSKVMKSQVDYEASSRRTAAITSGLNNLASAAGSYGMSQYGGGAGTMGGASYASNASKPPPGMFTNGGYYPTGYPG